MDQYVALHMCATNLAGALDERRELLRKAKARREKLTGAEEELIREPKFKGAAKRAADKVRRVARRNPTISEARAQRSADELPKCDSE